MFVVCLVYIYPFIKVPSGFSIKSPLFFWLSETQSPKVLVQRGENGAPRPFSATEASLWAQEIGLKAGFPCDEGHADAHPWSGRPMAAGALRAGGRGLEILGPGGPELP